LSQPPAKGADDLWLSELAGLIVAGGGCTMTFSRSAVFMRVIRHTKAAGLDLIH
jgi:hypothetical protein